MNNIEMYHESYSVNLQETFDKKMSFLKNRIKNVFELIGPVKGKKILDIGTSNGLFAIECSKKGATSFGLDFSKIALRSARLVSIQKSMDIEFVCGECSILPFKSNIFDVLILADLVEHLNKPLYDNLIGECWRVLKKGGLIAIYTPNSEHIIEQLRNKNLILSSFKEHTNLMNMGEVATVLEKNNFFIVKKYYKQSHIPIFNVMETILSHLPIINKNFRRRINVLGRK